MVNKFEEFFNHRVICSKKRVEVINIIGDSHDTKSLKKILDKFDNVISLGDIGAAVEKNEIFSNNNLERYGKAWKSFAKQDFSAISKKDKNWFKMINIDGWIKQLNTIKNSKKTFILNMGNTDFGMISFFPECAKYLKGAIKKSKLDFIKVSSLIPFGNIQLIFLPYRNDSYKIDKLLKKIDLNKPLFVLAHCPAFKVSKKQYYMNCYKAVKLISNRYDKKFYYLHGHVHPDKSYIYTRKSLPNVTFLAPKSEENFEGFGINHHVIQINIKNGLIKLLDSVSSKYVSFEKLPKEFHIEEDHWNFFMRNKK